MRLVPYRMNTIISEHAQIIACDLSMSSELSMRELQMTYQDSNGIITQCCNCRKVRAVQAIEKWDWAEAFITSTLPNISHGLCPSCLEELYPDPEAD